MTNNPQFESKHMFGPLDEELEVCFGALDIDPGTDHMEAMPQIADATRSCGFRDVHADHIAGADQPTKTNGVIFDVSFDIPGPGRGYVEYDSQTSPGRDERKQLRQGLRGLRPEDELYHVTPSRGGGVNVDRFDEESTPLDRLFDW